MRIGPIVITRLKRDKLGRPLHPWEIVTLDQLSEDARLLITKMSRVAARDFYEERREEWREQLRTDLKVAIEQIEGRAQRRTGARSLMDSWTCKLPSTNRPCTREHPHVSCGMKDATT